MDEWTLSKDARPYFAAAVPQCTVPIIPANGDEDLGLGSGVFLRLADEYLLLTARHVFEPYAVTGRMTVRVGGRVSGLIGLVGAKIHVTTGADDVAIVRVPLAAAQEMCRLGYVPATSQVLHSSLDDPSVFAFCGYPSEVVRKNDTTYHINHLLMTGIEATTPSPVFSNFSARDHIAFNWPSERTLSVKDEDGIPQRSLAGCGKTWRTTRREVWQSGPPRDLRGCPTGNCQEFARIGPV